MRHGMIALVLLCGAGCAYDIEEPIEIEPPSAEALSGGADRYLAACQRDALNVYAPSTGGLPPGEELQQIADYIYEMCLDSLDEALSKQNAD